MKPRFKNQEMEAGRITGDRALCDVTKSTNTASSLFFLLLLTFLWLSGAQQSSPAELIVQRCPAGVLDETQRPKNKNASNQKGTHLKQSA